MAVSLYFGLPGSGKTTLLTAFAKKFVKSKKYENVYTNCNIKVKGVTIIPNDFIGEYELINGAILIDEALLFAPSRDWKKFEAKLLNFFILHRHDNVDVYLFSQRADGCDKNIRAITDRVFYLYKPFLIGKWFTKFYKIPYGIIIPDGKNHSDGQKLGEILQGYCKPPWIIRLISPMIYRPKYYKYFDSWERIPRKPLPNYIKPIEENPQSKIRKMIVFLKKNINKKKDKFLHK